MIRDTTIYVSLRDADDRRLIVDGALELLRDFLATLTRSAEPTPAQSLDTGNDAQETGHATRAT